MENRKVGDTFIIPGSGVFEGGVVCIILELSRDGRIVKAKAAVPDARLARVGFIIEGEDFVLQEWHWSNN